MCDTQASERRMELAPTGLAVNAKTLVPLPSRIRLDCHFLNWITVLTGQTLKTGHCSVCLESTETRP
eukprot:1179418-Prorocentrum_minimum.AAC.6